MALGMLGSMAAALGAGADGFGGGMDRSRKLKQEDEDRSFQADQRKRMTEQQDREKQVRDAIDKAAKDFIVEPVPGEAKPETMDNRDVGVVGEQTLKPSAYRAGMMTYATQGEAQAAATASAQPAARQERVASAMESNGDALGGAKMRNVMQQQKVGDQQLKIGEAQLKQVERKDANDTWDDNSKTALLKGGPDGFAKFLTESKGDTAGGAAQFQATRSADGKTWRIDMVGPNGELIPRTQEFTNDARGYAEAHVLFSLGVPETQKLAHYVAQQNANTASKFHDAQVENMREQRRLQERQLNITQQLANQKGAAAGATAEPPIWDAKADEFLKSRYTVKDPMTGTTDVDGHGLLFAKTIAQAAARDKFGGDTTRALGLAFELDNKIKADAKGDPAKIKAGRDALLSKLMGAGAAPAQTPVSAPAAPAQAASTAPAPRAAASMAGVMSPQATPAEQILATMTSTAGGDSTLKAMAAQKAEEVTAVAQQLSQAKAQLAAVAKSGDQVALQRYAQSVQALRNQLNAVMKGLPDDQRQKLAGLIESQ